MALTKNKEGEKIPRGYHDVGRGLEPYNAKWVYYPNHAPEDFFKNVTKRLRHGKDDTPKGPVFLRDERINDEYQRWCEPTELSENMRDYIIGGKIVTIRVIPWDDGRVLTQVCCDVGDERMSFTVDFWVGLACKEVVK